MNNKLKSVRKNAGLTQQQLAEAMGTSKSYICQLENGSRNIYCIRKDTMRRLCDALKCEPQDLLLNEADFEYTEDGKLLIDALYLSPSTPDHFIIKIGNEFFLSPNVADYQFNNSLKPLHKHLTPIYKEIPMNVGEANIVFYPLIGCFPKKGFKPTIGRAITEKEFEKLKDELDLTDDDISGEFVQEDGEFYGKEAIIAFTAIQIAVDDNKALEVESKLVDLGIEAISGTNGRVTIRVK